MRELWVERAQHGNDAEGAFIPQAIGFTKARRAAGDEVELVPFDPTIADGARRRARILALIGESKGVDAFVYFGHGLRTGLLSAGFTMQTIDQLVSALHAKRPRSG